VININIFEIKRVSTMDGFCDITINKYKTKTIELHRRSASLAHKDKTHLFIERYRFKFWKKHWKEIGARANGSFIKRKKKKKKKKKEICNVLSLNKEIYSIFTNCLIHLTSFVRIRLYKYPYMVMLRCIYI
jgi:hypothetical protein